MRLGLVMIVKNELVGIEATLRSVMPFIDHWTILDTGSTDGTQDKIREVLADIPGTLHEEPFVDFATTRNRVLELHGTATTFAIMLSGDDILHNGQPGPGVKIDHLRSYLSRHASSVVDAFDVFNLTRVTGTTHYAQAMVVRCGAGWQYAGRTHEVLTKPGATAMITIPQVTVTRAKDGDAKSKLARWQSDLVLLQLDIDDGHDVSRSTFYLAQTHECLGDFAAARRAYWSRIELEGFWEERYEAMYRLGRVTERMGDWPAAQQHYLDAHAFSATRAEPLYAIASWYYRAGNHPLCYLFARRAAEIPMPRTRLFVEPEIYLWRAHDLVAVSAYQIGRSQPDIMEIGRQAAHAALRGNPKDGRLIENAKWFERADPEPVVM